MQDQVFAAVQEIAKLRNFDFIFDRTSEIGMIYADQQYDVSDLVLRTIKRTANRKQLEGKEEIQEMEKKEELSIEQEEQLTEREQMIEQRKKERDSLAAARKKKNTTPFDLQNRQNSRREEKEYWKKDREKGTLSFRPGNRRMIR